VIPLGVAEVSPRLVSTSCWSTSTFGETGNALAKEFSALGDHLDLCRLMRGRLFAVQCMADTLRGFLAARFVTTVVVTVSVFAVVVATVV
jgi:hypothetical protein